MIGIVQNYLAGGLLIIGALFSLIAALGLVRLPDLYTRMHAASKAGTMGSCVMLIAIALHTDDATVSMRAVAGIVFFLLTAPVSAHLLAKAAHGARYRLWRGSVRDEMSDIVEHGPGDAGKSPL